LFVVLLAIAPASQELEPPTNPGRFIPTKRNRKAQHSVNKPLYALRARIECFIGNLKNQRRVATRYDHTATSFLGFVLLGCIRIWFRFVHMA
jgi:transposase